MEVKGPFTNKDIDRIHEENRMEAVYEWWEISMEDAASLELGDSIPVAGGDMRPVVEMTHTGGRSFVKTLHFVGPKPKRFSALARQLK